MDTPYHEKKHKNQVRESFLNPKKTHNMTPMQTQTPTKTKNRKFIEFLMSELEADKIFRVKKVKPGIYYVYYKRCEYSEDDGECWFIESYVVIRGKHIEEKIIDMG